MILVVGATGILGMEICSQLRAANKPVRALVRHGSPREAALRAQGVEIVSGDIASRTALESACAGVTTVISTATAMASKEKGNSLRAVDRDGQLRLVDAARKSGVAHFIFISLSPHLREIAPLIRYKREVAAAARKSGMAWTILQPSAFMEIWLSKFLGWDFEKARAMIFGSGDCPVSWISVSDVARYAVLAVDDARLRNHDVPLGGPEPLSANAVKRIFEEVSGRSYSSRKAPAGILGLISPLVARIDDRVGSGMSLGSQMAKGDVVGSKLQDELGLKLTTVRSYAVRALKS
jgi:uncharacterized protein YbjT (DUF2867 family)